MTTGEIRFIDYGPVVDHGNVDAIRDLEKWIGGSGRKIYGLVD